MIRKMKRADFSKVNEIFSEVQDLHVEGRPDIFISKDPCPLDKFNERMHSKKTIKLVSIDDKKEVTGFLFAEVLTIGGDITHKRKIIAIHEIGVSKINRGTGFGTELFNEIKKIAKEKNCCDITLSVWQFNENAIRFYKKMGMNIQSLRMEIKI